MDEHYDECHKKIAKLVLVLVQSEVETKESIKLFTKKQEKILRMAMKNLICKGNEEARPSQILCKPPKQGVK